MAGQTLDSNFTQMLTDAQTQSQNIGNYLRGGTASGSGSYVQRHWMIPSRASSFNPTNISQLGYPVLRSSLNQEYSQQLTTATSNSPGNQGATGGMVGNIIVSGLQINYMAMWERSFRERHKTDVRCQMHLCGRRLAHGDQQGVHVGLVQPFVQQFINVTKVVPN